MSIPESRIRISELAERYASWMEVLPEDREQLDWCTKIVSLVACPAGLLCLTNQGVDALMLHRASPNTLKPKPTKRTGRRRKDEPSDDSKIVAMLAVHHQYEQGGSIGNWQPVKGTDLANDTEVTQMAVSRFMQKHFKNHKGYEAACRRKDIGYRLAELLGDVSERHADLRPEESGRREEVV